MLFKDGKHVQLSKAQIASVKKAFGDRFPVRAVYPVVRVKRSRLKHNVLPDKPAGISFPLNAVRKTLQGSEHWRFADQEIVLEGGKKRYTPQNFNYSGSVVLEEKDIELIWYLLEICPYTQPMTEDPKDRKNWNGKPPKIAFENKVKEANDRAKDEERTAEFKALIWSTKLGLKEPKLRQVAKALMVSDVDELTVNEVKIAIEKAVTVDRKEGIRKFLIMVNSEAELQSRSMIQAAADRKILKFVPNTKEWVWLDENGKKREMIMKLGPAVKNPHDAIYDKYVGDDEFRGELESILKTEGLING